MSDTVLAALITGTAGLIGGALTGALAVYFTQRRHNQTMEEEARRREEDREEEARRRENEAQLREDEARRQLEKAHRREAVAYLKSIAVTIRGMREKIAKSEIPYDHGHEFLGLIDGEYYKGLLQPYLGAKTQPELEKLRWVHDATVGPDKVLKEGGEVDPETLRNLLADMQRVEGDVRAQATRISPTENRAN